MVRLGDACEFIRGVTFPSGEGESKPFAGAIACLTTSGVQREVAWKSRRFIPRTRVGKDAQLLRAGDILISTANSKELVGKSCLVHRTPFDCTFGAFVTGARPRKSVFPGYLAFWMTTPEFLGWCYQRSTNTTNISNLRVSELEELEFFLPPLSEQRRIAGLLEQADRLRHTRRYALELSHSFLPAAFLELFGDPQSGSGKKAELHEVAEILTGYPFTSEDYTETGDTVRLCRGANVLPNRIDWSDLALWPISKSHDLSKYQLQVGDVVIAMDRPWISEGFKIAQIRAEHCPTLLVQRVARLRGKNGVPNAFLYHLLKHPAFTRHCRPTETTIPHISPTDLETFSFHVPSPALQQKFAALVERHEQLRATQREALRQAEHLFQTLLHRAFSEDMSC